MVGVGGVAGVGVATGGGVGGGAEVDCTAGGCSAAGAACGCAAGGAPTMSFVGFGRGSYATETKYRFVGFGAGEFDYVKPRPGFPWLLVLGLLALIVVIVVIIILLLPSPSTTTPAPTGPPASCLIWGDPHFDTFDHAFPNNFEEGEFWIVQSKMVWIQGRYLATPFTNGLSATHAIAVGGPFLLGHTVVVGPMENGDILVDGQPALTMFPSSTTVAGVATLSYNGQGNLVDAAQSHLEKHIVHMDLPLGVHLQVMRWANHINVRITMTPRVGGQKGDCGNFNSLAIDDVTGLAVSGAECLFHHMTPVRPGPHHTIEECIQKDPTKYHLALRTCQAEEPQMQNDDLKRGCVFDVCWAGPQYAAQDGMSESTM